MKRRIYFIIIAVLALIFFTGGAPTEIAEKTIVSAIGIDCKDDKCRVTMQVFRPEGSGSQTAVDPSLPNVSIIKGEGKTVGDAIEKCRSRLGGEMYIGKNRILIFGKETDLSDIDRLAGGLVSDPECYYKLHCAVAEGSAEKLLETPVLGGAVGSERYTQMIETARVSGSCTDCTLDELYTAMKSGDGAVILPMFSKCEDAKGESSGSSEEGGSSESLTAASDIKLDSCALYRGGKFIRTESGDDMGMLAAVTGKSRAVKCDGMTFRVLSRDIKPILKDGSPCFEVRLKLFCSERLNDTDEQAAREKLVQKSEQLITELNREISPFVTDSDKLMKKYFPGYYKNDRHLTNPHLWYIIEL